MSFSYLAGGRELWSDVPLPSLCSAPAASASASAVPGAGAIHLVVSGEPFEEPARWLYTERYDETLEPWRAVGARDREYLVRLFGFADFLLEKGGHTARVRVAAGAPESAIEPLFLEQVLPLWWSLLGRPCLHASAVAWGEGEGACAIAFAGASGAGKSTLATSLAGAGGLLADDCLALDVVEGGVLAYPGHRAVRLFGDSAEALFASAEAGELAPDGEKRRVVVPAADRSLPLARIYLLERPASSDVGTARAERLRLRDAVSRLAGCLFRIDPEDRSQLAGELDLLGRIAAGVPVARLVVPRRFEELGGVRGVIEADLRGDGAGAPGHDPAKK